MLHNVLVVVSSIVIIYIITYLYMKAQDQIPSRMVQFLTANKYDDWYDRMSSRITSFMLVVLAIFMTFAQTIIRPIECQCPTNFTEAQKKYTNNFCWVQNKYYLPFHKESPKPDEERQFICYYQFTMFILVGQAILYFLPSVVWHGLNSMVGNGVLHKAEFSGSMEDFIIQFKQVCQGSNQEGWGLVHFCRRRLSGYLVLAFLFTKILYIINAVGQFWLLNIILFNKFNLYGFEVLGNVVADHNWEHSPFDAFPRVAMCDVTTRRMEVCTVVADHYWHNAPFDAFPRNNMCDVTTRRMGNLHHYTVQCTSPLNYLNEKVFMFLWFWMALVAGVTIFGFLQWMLCTTWQGMMLTLFLIT